MLLILKLMYQYFSSIDDRSGNQVQSYRGRRVYLRRLSGSDASTSTEALLGTLENDQERARLILRLVFFRVLISEANRNCLSFSSSCSCR